MFEIFNNQFNEDLWIGIYRDNVLLLFQAEKSLSHIKIWREEFQTTTKESGN